MDKESQIDILQWFKDKPKDEFTRASTQYKNSKYTQIEISESILKLIEAKYLMGEFAGDAGRNFFIGIISLSGENYLEELLKETKKPKKCIGFIQ